MIDIIVIPYRDEAFLTKYGPIVRDWHIILGLAEQDAVSSITIINRPNPPFLDLIRKKNGKVILVDILNEKADKIKFISSLSFDFSWIYKKRLWTVGCYQKIVRKVIENNRFKSNKKTIVLDFTPMGKMPNEAFKENEVIYWYDMIDNFSKHNRFTDNERKAVKEKYKLLSNQPNNVSRTVTCVAPGCQAEITDAAILPNGLVNYGVKSDIDSPHKYDFGFCGFITDKFDVRFVTYLCELGYSVVIWGECYSQTTMEKLRISGAVLKGRFTYKDFPSVFSSFKVGLVPYIKERSHDESPLKIYEYLRHGSAVLSLIKYEVVAEPVHYFSQYPSKDEIAKVMESTCSIKSNDIESIIQEAAWGMKVKKIISQFNSRGDL